MGLFSAALTDQINEIAAKSNETAEAVAAVNTRSMNDDLNMMSKKVMDYFKDSPAILISTKEELHNYVDKCIETGYAGIDTETTGLDRIHDHVVGASLYTPGLPECYIPIKHLVPIFDTLYKNQLTYEEVGEEFQRLVDGNVKLIFANADFDIAMIYKDIKVDTIPAFYYDVITAWRCLKENEPDNSLKGLYAKYVKKGQIDPQKFSDFFSPKLFPNCKPQVAALYAANDAKITYELFLWQLPYVTKTHEKCQKHHLEKIADLVWNIEFPLVAVCAHLHRRGVFLDDSIAIPLHERYTIALHNDEAELARCIQELIDTKDIVSNRNRPFRSGSDFNPNSNPHVKYLVNQLLGSSAKSTGKEILKEINKPSTKAVLKVRGDVKLLSTYVDKLPRVVGPDHRIHSTFKAIGADTGRMCIAEGTMITILNGTKKIEDIVPGDLVYCYDDEGNLQLSKVKNLWKTGENRECVTIKWQSSGSGDIGYLTCTPEHPILKKDGTWCEAKDLKRYDKLAHLRRTQGSSGEPRPNLYGWNGLATREQDVVKYSIFGADSSMHLHHKDGNCSNNDIDNLEILSNVDHARLHGKQSAINGTLKYEHLRNPEIIDKCTQRRHQQYIEKTKGEKDVLIQAIHDAKGRLSCVPYDFDSFKHRCEIAGVDYISECRKAGNIAFKYRKARDISESEFREAFILHQGDYQKVSEFLNISQYTFYQKCKEYSISLNHMVQSVTTAGTFDVYDIEVETYHNFIANEICVHNSSEAPNMQNIPSHALDIRHMFRATPEQTEQIKLDKVNETISVTLNNYDKVPTPEGLIEVKDLQQSSIVTLKEDGVAINYFVSDIQFDKGQAVIHLKKGGQIN